MIETLIKLFSRDLDALRGEIDLYSDEEQMWVIDKMVNNSAGTLSLHLCGNLQHFIGSILGNTGYVRDREGEFTKKISKAELLEEIQKTKSVITNSLNTLPNYRLKDIYPIEVFGHEMTIEYFLTHLHGHLTYHLGQISYHRRLV